jgi:hypothetical protein
VAELSFPAGIVRMLRGLVAVFQHERTGHRKTNVIREAVLEILIIFFCQFVYILCAYPPVLCVLSKLIYYTAAAGRLI